MSACGDVVLEARIDPRSLCDYSRLIHKYYLPRELKGLIRLAHIEAIGGAFDGEGGLPEPVPGVIFRYVDIGAERRLDPQTVAAVWAAHQAFMDDHSADLTPAEVEAVLTLNRRLEVIERSARADSKMMRALLDQSPHFKDAEITLVLTFFLREDDPLGDEEVDHGFDVDGDIRQICQLRYDEFWLFGPESERFGLDDHNDHKAIGLHQPAPLHEVRHTYVLHELYEHVWLPLNQLGRIGHICAEIKAEHQRCHQ